jgi:alpha-amylase/alpha-mannosidase (GH57 family)
MIRKTKDIVLYENFLTADESKKVIQVLDKCAETGKLSWTPISFYESYSSVLPQDNDPILEEFELSPTFFSDLKNKIINAVASVHDLDPSVITQIGYHTQKWEPGAYARIHSDNTDEKGNTGPFARSRYAAFLYLNEDFEGGVLRFPKQDLEIHPKTGLLAAFDGGFNNMHEVTLITKGTRYTLGSFWDDRKEEDYPEETRKQWAEEMAKIREAQAQEKKEWQKLLKDGYKIDEEGNPYRIEELD